MRLVRGFINTTDRLNNFFGEFFKWAFVIMCTSLAIEVVMRYFFNSPTVWVSDTCEQCCIAIGAFGGAYSYLSDGFVRVDLLYARLTPRGKALLDICTFPIILIFVYMITWQCICSAETSWVYEETSVTVMQMPFYYGRTAVALGALMLALQSVSVLLKNIYYLVKHESYPSCIRREDLTT